VGIDNCGQYSNVTDCAEGVKFDRQTDKMPAANKRFGATAAVTSQKRQCEIEK